jgi:hypothetical protein
VFSRATKKTCPKGAVDDGGGGGVVMFILNVAEVVAPLLSFTWIVNETDPATVGSPETDPDDEDNERPVGSCPLNTDHV